MPRRICRYRQIPGCLVPSDRPRRANCSVRRFIGKLKIPQALVEIGMKKDGVESRIRWHRIDSGRIAIDPVCDGAVSVVVVRIHARVATHLVSIPSLPHGSGTVFDEVAPRWILGVEKQAIRDLGVSGVCQSAQQVRRAQESRAKAPMVGLEAIHQSLCRNASKRIGQQVHVQGEYVPRLRFDWLVAEFRCCAGSEYRRWWNAADETIGPNVGSVESSFDLFKELAVFLFVSCFSK